MNFKRVQEDGLAWLAWSLEDVFPELSYRSWTRCGGVSLPPYDGLNLSYGVGDDPDRVSQNRRLVRLSMALNELISVGQVHGSNTLILSAKEKPQPVREVHGIDILITDIPGLGLLIKQADCQAVALYDPENQVIANIHCGWRGNVHDVIGQAVGHLRAGFGTRPENLRAALSPSLGPCCAEFINYRKEFPEKFWPYQVRPHFFDLWRLSCDQLQQAGVRPGNIHVAGWCSRCQEKDLFSYRRAQVTGRNGTVIALRRP